MNERDLKSESQRYLDEMMKFYSMNKNASVSTQKPPENVSGEFESNNNNLSEDIADEQLNEPENNSAGKSGEFDGGNNNLSEDIADEQLNEPENNSEGKSGEFDGGNNNLSEDIADEQLNRPEDSSADEDIPDDIKDETINESVPEAVSFESRFPVPVIPDFIRNPEPVKQADRTYNRPGSEDIPDTEPSDEGTTPYTDYGFLKVEVRTGENGLPVPGASVTVERKNGRSNEIIFTGTTDDSGGIEKIRLPAPPNSKGNTPESFENYSVYTVSAFYKDFYREVSADVPVFAGITSIQRFNLIPMPFNYDDNGQSMINNNTEPEI